MRSHNVTRTKNLEFKRGINSLLQADAWTLPDGRMKVMVFGSDKLSGVYTRKQYNNFAARKDVFLVEVVVRDKIE